MITSITIFEIDVSLSKQHDKVKIQWQQNPVKNGGTH